MLTALTIVGFVLHSKKRQNELSREAVCSKTNKVVDTCAGFVWYQGPRL